MPRTLVLFGAGPGIGNHVATTFASKGIDHIILLSRNTQRLEHDDTSFVSKASPNVKISTLRIDLADQDSVLSALTKLDDMTAGEDVEVVFFNAARIKPVNEVLDVSASEIEEDFKTTTLSLYMIAQHFLPKLQALASNSALKPALLVTSSHLPWDPVPQLLSLSLVKAAQRTMVVGLNRVFSKKGVHVGVVSVEGQVAEENKVLNPKTIADRAVEFWEKGVGAGVEVKIAEQ